MKNLFNGVRSIFKRAMTLTSEAGWSNLGTLGDLPGLSMPELGREASSVGAVHAALNARISAISKVPMILSDANDNLIESGPLYTLLNRPNRWQDRSQYIGTIEAMLTLYDECIVAMIGEPGKAPDELIPLNPNKLQRIYGVHAPTGLRIVLGYVHCGDHGMVTLDWDDVIPIIGVNPYAPCRGLPAVDAARMSVQQDVATRKQNLALFSNGGMVDIVLETSKNLDKQQRNEILNAWDSRHQGYTNAHKTGILWGDLKANKIGFNPAELQSFESLRMTLTDILMVMRVMPAMIMVMIGETGLSQGSSTAEQMVAWWSNVGLSELDRIAAAHQAALVDRFNWSGSARRMKLREQSARHWFSRVAGRTPSAGELFCYFDLNQIEELVEHRRKRIDQLDKLLNRGYLPDDLNDYFDLGLPPHPTNVGTLPFSLQAVTDLTIIESDPQGTALNPHDEDGTEEDRAASNPSRALCLLDQIEARVQRASDPAAQYQALQKAWMAWNKTATKSAAKKYSRHYLEQRDRVLKQFATAASDTLNADGVDKVLAQAYDKTAENEALSSLITPSISTLLEDAWTMALPEMGTDAKANPFSIDDPNIQKAIEKRKIQGLKINDTTEEDLRKIISAGVDEGSNTTTISDAIAQYYKENCVGENKARPITAARTQVAGIANDSRLLMARDVGGLLKGWLHGDTAMPREDHQRAQATYLSNPIPLDQKFVVGGEEMDAPGDPSASASQTANCSCMLVFTRANQKGEE